MTIAHDTRHMACGLPHANRYLDTDIGRATFLLTLENFAFFASEFGIEHVLPDILKDSTTRYVVVQFVRHRQRGRICITLDYAQGCGTRDEFNVRASHVEGLIYNTFIQVLRVFLTENRESRDLTVILARAD